MIQIDQLLFEVLVDLHERSGATREDAINMANAELRRIGKAS